MFQPPSTKCYTYFSNLTVSVQIGTEGRSPIDRKYLDKNEVLFSRLHEARELLDSWSGQGEKLQQANSLLREVLTIDPNYAPAYREYGRLLLMAGYTNYDNYNEKSFSPAESAIRKSIEIEPEYADSYVLLGSLYIKMKRYSEAKAFLSKAEKIGTGTPWLQINWATLLKKQRRYKEAMQRYQQVLSEGTPNRKAYVRALSGVTTMHRYMKDYDMANEGFKKQLEFSPSDAWIWGNYASFLLFNYSDVDGAIEKGRKALQIMDYGMGRFILGCALYTKWAMLRSNSATASRAQKYFDEAWSIYPHPKEVIEKTRSNSYTRITSAALEEWLSSKDGERAKRAGEAGLSRDKRVWQITKSSSRPQTVHRAPR